MNAVTVPKTLEPAAGGLIGPAGRTASSPPVIREGAEPLPSPDSGPAAPPSRRLISLDVFRGFTVFGMLLVNNAALDRYTPRQLTHAPWNGGIHFADLIFPWFLLIVGVAIPLSAASRGEGRAARWRYALKVFTRALTLVFLGCLIQCSLSRRLAFSLGVLQLIGLAYLCSALLHEIPLRRRILIAALLLLGHWAAIRFLPVPGVGAGVFTEQENLIAHVNATYLAHYHLNGLISVVPASALVLIGTAFGDVLRRSDRAPTSRAAWVLVAGVALVAVGWLWNLDLPFNKPGWTASYILYTAGLGALVLGFLYLLIDVNGRRAWAFPLVVFGSNAILAYVAPILVKVHVLQEWGWQTADGSLIPLQAALLGVVTAQFGRIPGGWIYTFGYILFWWLVLFRLYRKQVFLRV